MENVLVNQQTLQYTCNLSAVKKKKKHPDSKLKQVVLELCSN